MDPNGVILVWCVVCCFYHLLCLMFHAQQLATSEETNSTSCQPCPANSTSSEGSSSWKECRCPYGSVQEEDGQLICQCPEKEALQRLACSDYFQWEIPIQMLEDHRLGNKHATKAFLSINVAEPYCLTQYVKWFLPTKLVCESLYSKVKSSRQMHSLQRAQPALPDERHRSQHGGGGIGLRTAAELLWEGIQVSGWSAVRNLGMCSRRGPFTLERWQSKANDPDFGIGWQTAIDTTWQKQKSAERPTTSCRVMSKWQWVKKGYLKNPTGKRKKQTKPVVPKGFLFDP